MRRLHVLGLPAMALVIAACAPTGGWTKPGVNRDQVRRDSQECERQATEAGRGIAYTVRFLYEECMREKGYQLGKL